MNDAGGPGRRRGLLTLAVVVLLLLMLGGGAAVWLQGHRAGPRIGRTTLPPPSRVPLPGTPAPPPVPGPSPTTTPAPAPATAPFLLGMNYPWHSYGNDFGQNAWGAYGVHDPTTGAAVDADFAKLEAMGVHVVRWFVFADGRAGIVFDAGGLPTGLDASVFPDMDAALQIAAKHRIQLDLVLLDFKFLENARTENGVQMGGHAAVIASAAGQQALLTRVFAPLFTRYGANPSILSWEIMNEPEWAITDFGHVEDAVSQPVSLATFRAFAGSVVDAIHRDTHAQATIGSATAAWVRDWTGLGLDFYQAHYYDWMQDDPADDLYALTPRDLGADRPVVVGEFPASGSKTADLSHYLSTWLENGYAGAWAWSLNAADDAGSPDPAALRAWATAHAAELANATP